MVCSTKQEAERLENRFILWERFGSITVTVDDGNFRGNSVGMLNVVRYRRTRGIAREAGLSPGWVYRKLVDTERQTSKHPPVLLETDPPEYRVLLHGESAAPVFPPASMSPPSLFTPTSKRRIRFCCNPECAPIFFSGDGDVVSAGETKSSDLVEQETDLSPDTLDKISARAGEMLEALEGGDYREKLETREVSKRGWGGVEGTGCCNPQPYGVPSPRHWPIFTWD